MRCHPLFISLLTLLILSSIRTVSGEEQFPQYTTGKLLYQWASASRFLSPQTPQSTVEQFKEQNRDYFTGHELALISEFQKPVSAEQLQKEFRWQIIRQTRTRIILKGEPRDPLTARLCRSFELQINPQSMLPESLTFQAHPEKENPRFASIELTALKVRPTVARVQTSPQPDFGSQKVANAVFPQAAARPAPAQPINRVSFSRFSTEEKKQAELREIEILVARWVSVSSHIDSIRLGNGVLIVKDRQQRPVIQPQSVTVANNESEQARLAFFQTLPQWLFDVDQKTFQIESFTIELSTDDSTTASRTHFITLKLRPHPENSRPDWDSAELEFSSNQPLPIRVSETRNNRISQFLLSDIQIHYAE